MVQIKPKVFVGSSSEGLDLARAVHTHLAAVSEVTVWKDEYFRQNEGSLEALLRGLAYFDFAVLVLTPDDRVTSRDEVKPAPRDNVIFEFGLFLGALGKTRCFAIASDDRSLKLPSDLHGVTISRFESNRSESNNTAAVATACALIKSEITKLGCKQLPISMSESKDSSTEPSRDTTNTATNEEHVFREKWGFVGDATVKIAPLSRSTSDFFHEDRFTFAFPGLRGVKEFTDPRECVERLSVLLENPLAWVWAGEDRHGFSKVIPIWWWRGYSNCPITSFRKLSDTEILIGEMELPIKRLIAVNLGAYWQSFIYLEVLPKESLFPATAKSNVDDELGSLGYSYDEYGLFQGRVLTRAEYDDGAAIIDGKPTRTTGAELRWRALTPYNMIIAPQESPINCKSFDKVSEEILNGILTGKYNFDHFLSAFKRLEKTVHRRSD